MGKHQPCFQQHRASRGVARWARFVDYGAYAIGGVVKLVRDCIPQIIEEDGRVCKWRRVIGRDEHIAKLSAKMREEVWEFTENPSYEEAADMLEVVKAFCYLHNLEWEAVKAYAQDKQESHGGFHSGIILESFDRKS